MNETNILIDTNIVLYYLHWNSTIFDFMRNYWIIVSVITEIELLSYNKIRDDELVFLKKVINTFEVEPLSDDIIQTSIELRRKYWLKIPDAIIAATALVNKVPLLTADKQLFGIWEIDIIQFTL